MDKKSIEVGEKYFHQISFSQNDVIKFAELTNDTNPIHLDEEYASKSIFKKTIVPGFLSGAVFSKVFGTLFPGIGTIYLYQEMKFKKPVFVNENYLAEFEVLEIDKIKNRATIYCKLIDLVGTIYIEGKAIVMHPDRIN
ncbi:MAG: MaoC family dehydratase [Bacteroidales bacterium]|nr:MaoC family dehydratase [Bacteroidales bacterium]